MRHAVLAALLATALGASLPESAVQRDRRLLALCKDNLGACISQAAPHVVGPTFTRGLFRMLDAAPKDDSGAPTWIASVTSLPLETQDALATWATVCGARSVISDGVSKNCAAVQMLDAIWGHRALDERHGVALARLVPLRVSHGYAPFSPQTIAHFKKKDVVRGFVMAAICQHGRTEPLDTDVWLEAMDLRVFASVLDETGGVSNDALYLFAARAASLDGYLPYVEAATARDRYDIAAFIFASERPRGRRISRVEDARNVDVNEGHGDAVALVSEHAHHLSKAVVDLHDDTEVGHYLASLVQLLVHAGEDVLAGRVAGRALRLCGGATTIEQIAALTRGAHLELAASPAYRISAQAMLAASWLNLAMEQAAGKSVERRYEVIARLRAYRSFTVVGVAMAAAARRSYYWAAGLAALHPRGAKVLGSSWIIDAEALVHAVVQHDVTDGFRVAPFGCKRDVMPFFFDRVANMTRAAALYLLEYSDEHWTRALEAWAARHGVDLALLVPDEYAEELLIPLRG